MLNLEESGKDKKYYQLNKNKYNNDSNDKYPLIVAIKNTSYNINFPIITEPNKNKSLNTLENFYSLNKSKKLQIPKRSINQKELSLSKNVNSLESNIFFTECFKNQHQTNQSHFTFYSKQKIKMNISKENHKLQTLSSISNYLINKDEKYSLENIRKMINDRNEDKSSVEFQDYDCEDIYSSEKTLNFKNYFSSNLKSGFISKEKCREFVDKTKEIAFQNRLNFYKKEFIKNIEESVINQGEIINNTTTNLIIAKIAYINNFSSEYIRYCRKVKRLKDFEIGNLDWYNKRRMDIDFNIKTVEQKLQKLKETIEKYYEYKLFFTAIKNKDINLLKIKAKIDFKIYFEILRESLFLE